VDNGARERRLDEMAQRVERAREARRGAITKEMRDHMAKQRLEAWKKEGGETADLIKGIERHSNMVLKSLCKENTLPVSGCKALLVERLVACIQFHRPVPCPKCKGTNISVLYSADSRTVTGIHCNTTHKVQGGKRKACNWDKAFMSREEEAEYLCLPFSDRDCVLEREGEGESVCVSEAPTRESVRQNREALHQRRSQYSRDKRAAWADEHPLDHDLPPQSVDPSIRHTLLTDALSVEFEGMAIEGIYREADFTRRDQYIAGVGDLSATEVAVDMAKRHYLSQYCPQYILQKQLLETSLYVRDRQSQLKNLTQQFESHLPEEWPWLEAERERKWGEALGLSQK
ncbi:hypothetical protein KIPB_007518, partial [Kipferlia bialata]